MNVIRRIKERIVNWHGELLRRRVGPNDERVVPACSECDELAGYPITREEGRVLARHWLRVAASAAKIGDASDLFSVNVCVRENIAAERRYRRLAEVLGPTEVESLSREVEAERGVPVLFRVDAYELDADEPLSNEQASWGVCPICYRNNGFVIEGRVAWVYCESHRCAWRVSPWLVSNKLQTLDDRHFIYQRIVGFSVLTQPARLPFNSDSYECGR